MDSKRFQLILIGAGTAALSALDEALTLGVERIALIDIHEKVGGECAWNACVPTKTILTAARLVKHLKTIGPQYGVTAKDLQIDFKTLMAKVDAVIEDGYDGFENEPRVTRFTGHAQFIAANQVQVNGAVLTGEKIIIAAGAHPVIPKIQGLEDVGYLKFQQATHMDALPESMVIIGGGPVGVEFSQMFQLLGCQVTLLQKGPSLLNREDPEIQEKIRQVLEADGVRVFTDCDIGNAQCQKGNNCKTIDVVVKGESKTITAAEILIVAGVSANVTTLGLDKANIHYDQHGIKTNASMQTNQPHIWAIGDVVGPYQFTHIADMQGVVAVRHAFDAPFKPMDYHAVAWATYTEPAVARVGMTVKQAQEKGLAVEEVRIETSAVSRYRIESEPDGFLKLVVQKDSRKILGGHLIASNADDVIHLLVLAVQKRLTVADLLEMIYIYPTKSQIIQKALEKLGS